MSLLKAWLKNIGQVLLVIIGIAVFIVLPIGVLAYILDKHVLLGILAIILYLAVVMGTLITLDEDV